MGKARGEGSRWFRYLSKIALAIILPVFSAFVCGFAQSSTRSVSGIVTDREGDPLPSSVVQIEDTVTLNIRSFITRNDGAYYFMDLSPDRDYMIRARLPERVGAGQDSKPFRFAQGSERQSEDRCFE